MGEGPWDPGEQWLALIAMATADAIVVLDADAVLRWANPAAEQLFGYRLEDRLGRDLLELVHPDDLDLVVRSLAEMTNIEVPGAPLELRVRDADGRWVHVEVVTSNLRNEERIGGLIISIREITQRRAAERARSSAERVLDHTFAHNPVGLVLCLSLIHI